MAEAPYDITPLHASERMRIEARGCRIESVSASPYAEKRRQESVAQIYHLQRKTERRLAPESASGSAQQKIRLLMMVKSIRSWARFLGAVIEAVGGLLFGQAKRKHVLIYQTQ